MLRPLCFAGLQLEVARRIATAVRNHLATLALCGIAAAGDCYTHCNSYALQQLREEKSRVAEATEERAGRQLRAGSEKKKSREEAAQRRSS